MAAEKRFEGIPPTELLYHADTYRFEAQATLLTWHPLASEESQHFGIKDDGHFFCFVLDATIFHPQGGGQPSDVGSIDFDFEGGAVSCRMLDSRIDRGQGIVLHSCWAPKSLDALAAPVSVRLTVDAPLRRLHAAIHSTGHLLDAMMRRVGRTDLVPTKGFHGTQGAFVEYEGNIEPKDRAALAAQLQQEIDRAIEISADASTTVSLASNQSELQELCGPAASSTHLPARIVKLGVDELGCPCGGTHIKTIGDLRPYRVKIGKIAKKGKAVRISYQVQLAS